MDENEPLFCAPALMLGEIHWHLLRASQLMYDKTIVETRGGERPPAMTWQSL